MKITTLSALCFVGAYLSVHNISTYLIGVIVGVVSMVLIMIKESNDYDS